MTRTEYIAIKESLARMRGLLPDPTPAALKAMETAGKTIDQAVREKFDYFMETATAGEKQFLAQVFSDRESDFGVPDRHELQIAGAFMLTMSGDDSKSVYDVQELDRLRAFWRRFHAEPPNLETELLRFMETAEDKQKAILRRALALERYEWVWDISPSVDVAARHDGPVTPAEEFLHDCLQEYAEKHGVFTPADAETFLGQFKVSFRRDDRQRPGSDRELSGQG
jgi:hypothetical protein